MCFDSNNYGNLLLKEKNGCKSCSNEEKLIVLVKINCDDVLTSSWLRRKLIIVRHRTIHVLLFSLTISK